MGERSPHPWGGGHPNGCSGVAAVRLSSLFPAPHGGLGRVWVLFPAQDPSQHHQLGAWAGGAVAGAESCVGRAALLLLPQRRAAARWVLGAAGTKPGPTAPLPRCSPSPSTPGAFPSRCLWGAGGCGSLSLPAGSADPWHGDTVGPPGDVWRRW